MCDGDFSQAGQPVTPVASFLFQHRRLAPNKTSHMKCWEIIADHPSKAGWSWGCVSIVDSQGRTIFIADEHRGG
jgi:hypothetical protein